MAIGIMSCSMEVYALVITSNPKLFRMSHISIKNEVFMLQIIAISFFWKANSADLIISFLCQFSFASIAFICFSFLSVFHKDHMYFVMKLFVEIIIWAILISDFDTQSQSPAWLRGQWWTNRYALIPSPGLKSL